MKDMSYELCVMSMRWVWDIMRWVMVMKWERNKISLRMDEIVNDILNILILGKFDGVGGVAKQGV